MFVVCENIEKKIQGVTVLKDINARFETGVVYGLWGKNGCGKTMLMRVMSNLIHPTSGKIIINGKEMDEKNERTVSIGALIESPAFLNDYTGFQNLELLASIQGKIGMEEIREALCKVGLDPDDKRKYRKYSLGMKQRLGIACAIMEKPDFIILDEPINAIDESGIIAVRKILEELKEEGKLIIVACHDKEELKQLVDEVYMMSDGTIVGHIAKGDLNDW